MFSNEPDRIPALIDPNIGLVTYHMLLATRYFNLSSFQTQCLLLLASSSLPCDFLLYSANKWLHKDSEIVHREVMVMSVDEFGKEVEIWLKVHCQVVLC